MGAEEQVHSPGGGLGWSDRWWLFALALLCCAAFFSMEATALNRWRTGHWYLADVGNIQQCLVNTWNGNFMWSPQEEGNLFAFHFTPFLLLVSPVIWLSEYAIPLVTLYVLALSLLPVPVYLLARRYGLPPYCGLALGVWLLGNHFVGSLELSYHFESFYVLFTLALLASLHAPGGQWIVLAILALSVKEDSAVWLAGAALWAMVFYRGLDVSPRRTVKLLGLCVVWAVLTFVVMRASAAGTENNAGRYLERMGGISLKSDNLFVLGMLVASSGLVCLFNWKAALLLLVPLPVILGNFVFTRHLLYYYSYPFLPFLAYATVAGAASIYSYWSQRGAARPAGISLAILFVALGGIQYFMPTRTDSMTRVPLPETLMHEKQRQVAAQELPADAPVALQFALWGITPWRSDAVLLKADQVKDHHYLFFNPRGQFGLSPDDTSALAQLLESEIEAGRRREIYSNYDLVVVSPATSSTTPIGGTHP